MSILLLVCFVGHLIDHFMKSELFLPPLLAEISLAGLKAADEVEKV